MQTQTARGEHASASLPARNPANPDSHEDVGNTSGEHLAVPLVDPFA